MDSKERDSILNSKKRRVILNVGSCNEFLHKQISKEIPNNTE